MTTQRPEANQQDQSMRQARAHRILDAATTLILRWGYNKTTIDDIAKQAGVAKGTIYLHWKTRDALFVALMKRERVALDEEFRRRISADPAAWTLHAILKHSALALMQRPLLKAMMLNDRDMLGKMVSSELSAKAYTERLAVFTAYLEFLREHDLVRTDLSIRAQVYIVSAIYLGFFLTEPLMPEEFRLSDDELAEMMAETAQRTLESDRKLTAEELQTIFQTSEHYMGRAIAQGQAQLHGEGLDIRPQDLESLSQH